MSKLIVRALYLLIFFQLGLCNLDKAMKTVKYCIDINNKTLDATFLSGTWYNLYKFAFGLSSISDEYCPTTIYTTPTKQELDEYKAKYDLNNETFSFEDGAVLSSQQEGRLKGIIIGNKTAKYFFLEPKSAMRLMGMYEVVTFKPINNDYLIYYKCNMRGHVKYLWSRKKDQSDAELDDILKGIYEVDIKHKQRYCKKLEVSSTTEYF